MAHVAIKKLKICLTVVIIMPSHTLWLHGIGYKQFKKVATHWPSLTHIHTDLAYKQEKIIMYNLYCDLMALMHAV